MASTQQHRPGAVVAGRYQLGESLGGGGVGQVYRAWDVQAQRTIAVKLFATGRCAPDALQRYGRLIAAAGRLGHPALVLPKGLGLASRDPPLIVMDALAGDDAARLRARLGRLPWARALDIVGRCAEVLHAVVSATKVAHRDLKPSNIFITDTGDVRVLDYGIAEFDVQSADSTRVDTALGVVDYKAPEQLEGAPTGEHTDVFSLGVVLFELLSGELPFRGASYYETARAILMSEAPRVADLAPGAGVPSGVEGLLRRALAKRPEQRFSSLKAMVEAIAQVRRAPGPGAPQTATGTLIDDDTPTAAVSSQRPRVAPARPAPLALSDDAPKGHTVVGGALGPRTLVGQTTGARDAPATADRTVVLGAAQAPGDRTVVFANAAPARGDATVVLPDPAAPARQDTTMVLPDPAAPARQDTTMVLPEPGARRPESTMALPESTMALPGDAAALARRPPERSLQRTLVLVNVACGLLIVIGVVVMLLTR